jgi:hypothetical protein
MYKNITWNTALAAERWRFNQKLKKNKKIKKRVRAQARKRSSLTGLKL